MTDETPQTQQPRLETEEHPLSLVLFAPLRGAATTILWLLVIASIALAAAGFFVKPGYHFPIESVPVIYGAIGAVAVGIAILISGPLGKLLRRPETFYADIRQSAAERRDKAGEAEPDA